MQAGSMVIYRLRAEKALNNMKKLLQGCDSREDVRSLVMQSWKNAEMSGMGSKETIMFKYEVETDNFSGKLLPIQHEAHDTSKDH
jgi:hypothetical protein